MDTFSDPDAASPPPPATWSGRYVPIEILGEGGMGVVWRVLDPDLGRHVALKVLQPHIQASTQAIQRFNTEARLTAQLQHPAIVPVYEAGRLPDGRLYFTMKEIRGTTLRRVIASKTQRLRRLVDALARVCQAIAYAHSRGVIHRDIKPDNIMLGEFGEVMVMDWGVARLLVNAPDGEGFVGTDDALQTQSGALVGTPAYMAPELIEGHPPDPASDVYALGAVLFEILSGTPRFTGSSAEIFDRILQGDGAELPADAPIGLQLACERAMSADPADRFADAGGLAEAISDWLDGVRLREQAMACVAEADALAPEIARLRAESAALRRQAAALLEGVRTYDPVERKQPAWTLEDQAAVLEQRARQQALTVTQQLHAALNILPSLPEAHARLTAQYHQEHIAAERRDETREAEHLEALLVRHDLRRQLVGYLTGDGAVSLITDPPGVTVALHRLVEIGRRLTPVFERVLGTTPLHRAALPRGRYLLILSAPGFHDVRYPVTIGRQEHWHGIAPGDTAPTPIWMPPAGSLTDRECYVPAGWCVVGGDEEALDSWPRRLCWMDGFIIQRFPVTIQDFVAYLQDMPRSEREGLIPEAHITHPPLTVDASGSIGLDSSTRWSQRHPMVALSHMAAQQFAMWAGRGEKKWRLPDSLEWEKAARSVDGWAYPWGTAYEATWTCTQLSHKHTPWIASVDDFAGDETIYGVRGMAGNINEWTRSPYQKSGEDTVITGLFVVRGGSYRSPPHVCRLATRTAAPPEQSFSTVGVRLARSLR